MSKILAVDDEPQILEIIKIHLQSSGYKCVTANSVEAALDIIKKGSIDLILSDLVMPKGDGVSLLKAVRNDLKLNTPFVILTGFVPEKDTLYDLGVDAVLGKPFHPESIKKCIAEHLETLAARLSHPLDQENQEKSIKLKTKFSNGFDNVLLQIGLSGIFVNKNLVENFDALDRGLYVDFDFSLPAIGGERFVGAGIIQWIRFHETAELQAGAGIKILYLDKTCNAKFCDYVMSNMKTSRIPIGRK